MVKGPENLRWMLVWGSLPKCVPPSAAAVVKNYQEEYQWKL